MIAAKDVELKKKELTEEADKQAKTARQQALDEALKAVEGLVLEAEDNFTTVHKNIFINVPYVDVIGELQKLGYTVRDNKASFFIQWPALEEEIFEINTDSMGEPIGDCADGTCDCYKEDDYYDSDYENE